MNRFLTALLCLCILSLSSTVQGQTARTVEGMLFDTESRPISGASVRLISDKDTLTTSSSNIGSYTFDNVTATKFIIRVSSLGFEASEKEVDFPASQKEIRVPSFSLKVNAAQIEEVVIEGVLTVQVKSDTVEYSTKDLKLREGAVAEDAIKRLQGLDVDKDGNVTAQGESVTRVRINGKDFFGGDVKTATKNLPANIIEKIQVVDDYGDMANVTGNKSGDSEKVLNIQIDPKYNKGYMTTLRVAYGNEDRYQTTAMWMGMSNASQVSVLGNLNNINAPLFDFNTMGGGARNRQGGGGRSGGGMFGSQNGLTNVGSIGVNIRHDFSEKLKVYGNYSFGRDDNNTLSNRINQYTLEDGTQLENSNSDGNNISASHRVEANLEWNITDNDYIKLTPQFGFNDANGETISSATNFFDDVLNNSENQQVFSTTDVPRYSISGLYNRKLGDKGRNFFVNFNYDNSATNNDYDRVLDRLIADPANVNTPLAEIYQQTLQELRNKSWNAGTTFSYTEPLSDFSHIEVTYDFNKNAYDNKNNQDAFDENGLPLASEDLNFHYAQDYSFTTHRFGANYAFENDKVKYSLGAAVQPSLLDGLASSDNANTNIRRRNLNYMPIARFEYKFSRQKNISINYSGRSTEPNINQILPYEVSINETNSTFGNPNLDPEFRHQLSLRFRSGDFQKGNTFFANLNGSLVNDRIISFSKRYNDPSLGLVQESRFLNAEDPVYNASGFYHFGKSIKEKTYNLMFMGGVNYNKNLSFTSSDPNAQVGEKNIINNWVFFQGAMFRYTPSENLEINPGVRYNYNFSKNSLNSNNNNVSTWTPTLIASINITKNTIFGLDLSKNFNQGFTSLTSANPFIVNTYIEQRLLKGQRGTIRLQAFDLLNEQTNISRTVQDNYFSDSQTNRLGRYFLLSFTFKLQKFSGIAPVEESRFPGGMRPPRM
ncbi:outer membrane beta-barrel protein [Sphingobacterium sp. HJSM2_6]|uniref:outer membrane beta-barrel protein n=1 Tax=Sphingobacterium sp. HJSM2_6 TaxID=3366264 RepID=UPI003BD92C12